MSRQKRQLSQSGLYHIIFRGIGRQNIKDAIQQFIILHKSDLNENFEITNSQRKNPEQIRRIIMSELGGKEPETLKEMDKKIRNSLIKKLIFKSGISKSALERATGIFRGTIIRICKEM